MECCAASPDPARMRAYLQELRRPASLLALAQEHAVLSQLSESLASLGPSTVPEALADAIRSARKMQTISTLALTAELLRVLDLLREAGIEALTTKGPTLALRAYGHAAARHYTDVDLLVRHSQISAAARIVSAAGFDSRIARSEIELGKTPGQYFFRRPQSGAVIELHTERTLRYFPRPLPIEDFFHRQTTLALDGRALPVLSAEDEFVLISIHGAKHFWERLMWISDVAAMVHRHPELNWQSVRQSAAVVGAERMVRVALLLAERQLRVPVPAEMKREVAADSACLPMIAKIESWLPYAGYDPPPLAQRALFRLRMRGHLLAGARYLTRLSLSTTEEDWSRDPQSPAASLSESLRRPFRLAKKYRRNPDR